MAGGPDSLLRKKTNKHILNFILQRKQWKQNKQTNQQSTGSVPLVTFSVALFVILSLHLKQDQWMRPADNRGTRPTCSWSNSATPWWCSANAVSMLQRLWSAVYTDFRDISVIKCLRERRSLCGDEPWALGGSEWRPMLPRSILQFRSFTSTGA